MPAPQIIDARTFLAQTKIGVFRGRKSLEKIDKLLEKCAGLDGKAQDLRIALMAALMEACQEWITKKALKSASDKGESENTAKRRIAVEALLMQAQKRFAYERFAQKKERARRMGAVAPVSKGLQSGYQPERAQFMKQRTDLRAEGKYGTGVTISPIGGSYAHEMHKLAHKGGVLSVPASPRDFDAFTVEDYRAYKATNESYTQQPYVHYMRKEERLGNMLTVKDGKLMYKGVLFTTTVQTHIFVMDLYGNLFFQNASASGRSVETARESKAPLLEMSQFNHSSLNAGNDVICAGVIVVEAGVLKSISNESGHYAPSHLNLKECVDVLIADGLDVSQATVSILTASPDSPFGPWAMSAFLADPSACLTQPRSRRRAVHMGGPPPMIP